MTCQTQATGKPYTDKENSACNALKQLSMVAFAMEHGTNAQDSGSVQTNFPDAPGHASISAGAPSPMCTSFCHLMGL